MGASAVLAGCGPRARFVASSDPSPDRVRTVVLATNRGTMPEGGIGFERTNTLSFAAVDVAVPADRQVGTTPFSTRRGAFTVAETRQVASRDALRAALAGGNDEDLTLWVHGFNTTTAEAVYRQAQMGEDFGMTGPQVTFAWPSAERSVGYLHDRDSVLHARTPFERLIRLLSELHGGRIIIAAHSLGSLLVMETLRQAALSGRSLDPILAGVVLIQPDLDPDVFRAQLRDIGPTGHPIAVVVAQDDPVLRLSARLSGRPRRVGAADNLDALRDLGLIVIDLTAVSDAGSAHFAAATSPTAIALIRGLRQSNLFEEASTND